MTFSRFVSRFNQPGRWLGLAALVLAVGCRMVEQTAKLPVKAVTALVPGTKTQVQDLPLLQLEIQRYADNYAGRTVDAIDDYVQAVGTQEVKSEALLWKLRVGSGMTMIASGPNPIANLFDMVTAATLAPIMLTEQLAQSPDRAALERWLAVSRTLETNAWALAGAVLNSAQIAELRKSILSWHETHPGLQVYLARTEGWTDLLKKANENRSGTGSLFSLVGLDPMAGLDPAVREVTLTRLFAERALYVGERMPFLIRLQLEVLADEIASMPAVTETLTNVTRLSRAVESASQTAAALPGEIADERKAILTALSEQEGKLRGLASEVKDALAAGEKMSTSLNTTLITFDALMKRFGVGEPDTNAVPDTNSVPFNILDYAKTAEKITLMAKQLDGLINDARSTVDSTALDKRIADLSVLSQKTTAEAKSVLNHIFLLCAGLVVLVFAGAFLYRRIGHR